MKRLFPVWSGLAVLIAASVFYSCDDSENGNENKFDRSALLENYADNFIKPAYNNLQATVNDLQGAAATFTGSPSETTLAEVQQKWEAAYVKWQYANAYNFGPAGEEGLKKGLIEEIGTFPVSSSKIETAISNGGYNMNDFNRDARGFLTVEYLIFSLTDDNASVVKSFESGARGQYLLDVIANLKARVDEVVNSWNGTYRNQFVANNGTDVGSSVSQMYNEFVRSYESIKNFKIGLPLGKRPGQTQPEPTKVEAYYSGKSVKMFEEHMAAIEAIWYGAADTESAAGFKNYLESVEGGANLVTSTEAQLAAIHAAMTTISETPRFSEQLTTTPSPIDALHTELQKNTRYFKSDMSSLLGIAITFSSGDGD